MRCWMEVPADLDSQEARSPIWGVPRQCEGFGFLAASLLGCSWSTGDTYELRIESKQRNPNQRNWVPDTCCYSESDLESKQRNPNRRNWLPNTIAPTVSRRPRDWDDDDGSNPIDRILNRTSIARS
ncbi:unnamed protein product [Linum trigynum]|uniref:Uncharacterized protein n=1 Tax=Linum trigynum TaxID=586398 RepID=A0AAV2GA51_9ROSI